MPLRIERSISAAEVVEALARHRWKVVLWTLIVLSAAVTAIVIWPRKYESEAKVFLRLGRESIALDPTATMGATVQIQESRENQLNSARDMFRSRALLEAVVEKFGAERILKGSLKENSPNPPSFASQLIASLQSFIATNTGASVSREEEAVEKLSKSIGVFLGKNTSVISITCLAKSPKLAQELLEEFLNCYREQHVSVNHTAGSFAFFTTQVTEAENARDKAIAELLELKNDLNLFSIPVEQESIQRRLTQVEADLMEANATLASLEASTASLQNILEKTPESLTTQRTTGFANVAADHMQQEHFKQLISVNELQAKLGEEHPLVKIGRDGVKRLQAIVDQQASDRVQTTTGVNPIRQSLETDLRREESLAASTRAKAATLSQQYSSLQERLRNLNQREVRVMTLERRVKIADANYDSYTERLEQARIGDALEAERISNINVVQAPSLVGKPVSPKPIMIFGVAFVAIVGGSLGLVFGLEFLSRTFADRLDDYSIGLHDNGKFVEPLPHWNTVDSSRESKVPLKG